VEGSYAWKVEREIERRFGVRHAVVVNSGTAALHCALVALGLRPGDEVVTSPLTFSATAAAIVLAGGVPVFADVCPRTFVLTKRTVSRVITRRTRAVLPVHLFGNLADVRELQSFGLPVLEDACQAVGTGRGGRYAGNFGIAGAYSFGSRKQCSAGEGGCIVTGVDAIARAAREFANHAENFGGPASPNYRPAESVCWEILHELGNLKDNTPFLRPYLVKQRGPKDKPYIHQLIDRLPAFAKYATDAYPVARRLVERELCVRSS
jgi:dTDP-4-amino-4,6-dideoxygalactose transaminase